MLRRSCGEITCGWFALFCMANNPWGYPIQEKSKSVGIWLGSLALPFPPPTSTFWPTWQGLVDWMLRLLPVGGEKASSFTLMQAFSSLCCLFVPEMSPDTWRWVSHIGVLEELTGSHFSKDISCIKEPQTLKLDLNNTRGLTRPMFTLFKLGVGDIPAVFPLCLAVHDVHPIFPQVVAPFCSPTLLLVGFEVFVSDSVCLSDPVFPVPGCLKFPDTGLMQYTLVKENCRGCPLSISPDQQLAKGIYPGPFWQAFYRARFAEKELLPWWRQMAY